MATHQNQYFTQNVREKAEALITAGRIHEGGIWRNRTRTVASEYGTWDQVPSEIKNCINQIGRAASMLGKKRAQEKRDYQARLTVHLVQKNLHNIPEVSRSPVVASKKQIQTLSRETLEDILHGRLLVPKIVTKECLQKIREYVTIASGFDPKIILLGIASKMEI